MPAVLALLDEVWIEVAERPCVVVMLPPRGIIVEYVRSLAWMVMVVRGVGRYQHLERSCVWRGGGDGVRCGAT